MLDELLDKWLKEKWLKKRVEKFFYYQYPLEKIYWLELFLIIICSYLITKQYFLAVSIIYLIRLYFYVMTKYCQKLYPIQVQKYNSLLKNAIYSGAEIIIFASFVILSSTLNQYIVFSICLLALSIYFFYHVLEIDNYKKNFIQVRADYLLIMAVGLLVRRVDYLMLFLIVLYAYAIYDFLLKILTLLKDHNQYGKNKVFLENKRAQIEKKYGIVKKNKKKIEKKQTVSEKSKKSLKKIRKQPK